MLFNEVKGLVQAYLQGEDSGTYDAVNKYLTSIYTDKERLAQETHELLQLLRGHDYHGVALCIPPAGNNFGILGWGLCKPCPQSESQGRTKKGSSHFH